MLRSEDSELKCFNCLQYSLHCSCKVNESYWKVSRYSIQFCIILGLSAQLTVRYLPLPVLVVISVLQLAASRLGPTSRFPPATGRARGAVSQPAHVPAAGRGSTPLSFPPHPSRPCETSASGVASQVRELIQVMQNWRCKMLLSCCISSLTGTSAIVRKDVGLRLGAERLEGGEGLKVLYRMGFSRSRICSLSHLVLELTVVEASLQFPEQSDPVS